MAFNVKIPELTGDYGKDYAELRNFLKEASLKIRLLEEELRKEMQKNGRKDI